MELKCTLETRQSKSGKDFQVLVVKLPQGIEKLIFLDPAELALIKLSNNK